MCLVQADGISILLISDGSRLTTFLKLMSGTGASVRAMGFDSFLFFKTTF